MPEDGSPPLGLRLQPRLLMLLSLELLYAEMVLMDSHAQDYLCAVLINHELVQVLPERLGRDEAGADIACAAQRATGGLVGLIEGREALAAEV
jgi:hypothetical protein